MRPPASGRTSPGVDTLPETVREVRATRIFDETTLPSGLRQSHRTRADTWGRIEVLEGRLRYVILEPEREEHELSPGSPGVIAPGAAHEVEPLGPVRFRVVFLRAE